ncbi:MAG: NfeD family protein [Niastella sp.]|nr:NfeD family protein [Niastella sp.]
MEILDSLEPLLRMFWFVAIPASVIFLIQTIMTFVGADISDGLDADLDGDLHHVDAPFQLFSLRNLINFLLGFSWTGISFYHTIPNPTLLITISLVVGILFVYIFFLVIRQIQKLGEDNSFKFSQTLNKTAEVYLTIPARRAGKGKIMISVNGSTRELDAMTDQENKIPSGAIVKVTQVDTDNILIVALI